MFPITGIGWRQKAPMWSGLCCQSPCLRAGAARRLEKSDHDRPGCAGRLEIHLYIDLISLQVADSTSVGPEQIR